MVERWGSPIIERRTSFKPQVNTTVSHLVSPRSPVRQTGFEKPKMKITYCSPVKAPSSNISDQFREEVNLSLKPSKFKPRGSSKLKPSLEFTSTMPNSLKTSRVEDKSVCVEVLTSVPTNNSNSVPRFSLNASKRFAMQQSIETEPITSFGKDLINHPNFESEKAEKDALPHPSLVKVMMFPFDEESSPSERSDMTHVI